MHSLMETAPSILSVFVYALLTAVATGLGALPFLFSRKLSKVWMARSTAMAAGLMLSASFSLVQEGIEYEGAAMRTIIGVLLGLGFITCSEKLVKRMGPLSLVDLKGSDAKRAVLIFAVMTFHSAAEGIGLGVSFGGGEALGMYITFALALHNVPEGLAISLAIVPKGTSIQKAAGYSILSSLPQPLLAVPAFLFVGAFEPILPVGLGFAAGAMLWMCFAELLPGAFKDDQPTNIGVVVTVAVSAMVFFQSLIH